MKVKTIYLDLQEAKKTKKIWKDVRTLESESFKQPVKMELCYDEEEKAYFSQKKTECEEILQQAEEILGAIKKEREIFNQYKLTTEIEINEKDKKILQLQQEKDSLLDKLIAFKGELKLYGENVKQHKEKLEEIETDIKNIYKNVKKEPILIQGTQFFSWVGESYIEPIKIKDWKYTLIFIGNIKEKNEYCTNKNFFITNDIRVKGGERLQPFNVKATTELDTPTVTVNYTLLFLPH